MSSNKNIETMEVDFREYLQLDEQVANPNEIDPSEIDQYFYDPQTGEKRELPPPPDKDGLFLFDETTGEWKEADFNPFDMISDQQFIDMMNQLEQEEALEDDYIEDEYFNEEYFDDDESYNEFLEDDYDNGVGDVSPFAPIEIGDYILHLYASEFNFCTPRINSYDKYDFEEWELMIEKKHPKWDFVVCSSEIMNEIGYDNFLKDDIYIAYADTELVQKIFNHLLEKIDINNI
jgi:hypothetical protein